MTTSTDRQQERLSFVSVEQARRALDVPGWVSVRAFTHLAEAVPGLLTQEDVKAALRACAQDGVDDSGACADEVLVVAERLQLTGRGVHVLHANALGRAGRPEDATAALLRAHAADEEGLTDVRAGTALKHIARSSGDDAVVRAVARLRKAGAVVAVPGQREPVLPRSAAAEALLEANTDAQIGRALSEVRDSGGIDLVTTGKVLDQLRYKPCDAARWADEVLQLATRYKVTSPRVFRSGLVLLADAGAVDQVRHWLEHARTLGHEASGELEALVITALANGLRFDEAVSEFEAHVASGRPIGIRMRKSVLSALAMGDRGEEALALMAGWAEDCRAGRLEVPTGSVLAVYLGVTLRTVGVAPALDVLRSFPEPLPLNATHRNIAVRHARSSRDADGLLRVLLLFAQGPSGQLPSEKEVRSLLDLPASQQAEEAVRVLEELHRAGALPAPLHPLLCERLLELGRLDYAEHVATSAPLTQRVGALGTVGVAHARRRDVEAGRRVLAQLHSTAGLQGKQLRVPEEFAAAWVFCLAHVEGVPAAERWLSTEPVTTWPTSAWEALATVHARQGRYSKVRQLAGRLRTDGRLTPAVFAQMLHALPRAKRLEIHPQLQREMSKAGVRSDAGYWCALIAGALLPEKSSGHGGEQEPLRLAAEAVRRGELLLLEAVRELLGQRLGFDRSHLQTLLRSYPQRRQAYAQLDDAFDSRLAALGEQRALRAFLVTVAAAHARAALPDCVAVLREIAALVPDARDPELIGSHVVAAAAAGQPEQAVELFREALGGRQGLPPLVASLLGEALGGPASSAVARRCIERLLDDGRLSPDLAEALTAATVGALVRTGLPDEARQVAAAAETRGVLLPAGTQALLLAADQPAPVESGEDTGPVWSTRALAAYNELLAHEMRQPLEVAKDVASSLTNLLKQVEASGPLDRAMLQESLKDASVMLRRALQRQRGTADKVSRAAALERSSYGAVDVEQVVALVQSELADAAAQAGARIRFLQPDRPRFIKGHATLVQMALWNLVSNALKAHREMLRQTGRSGDVDVLVAFDEATAEEIAVAPRGWVVLSVRDHGAGVPEGLPDNVANWRITGTPGEGAGIGLSTTEHMVRMSGGRLWVESTPDVGSRFSFRLPAAARPRRVAMTSVPADGTGPTESQEQS